MLRLEGISKDFRTGLMGRDRKRALVGVSISVERGQCVGLIGESGCGKSTLGKIALKLVEPTKGRIWLDDRDVTDMPERKFREWRSLIQIMFQSPDDALDPRYSLRSSIMEAIAKAGVPFEGRENRLVEMMERVNLPKELRERRPRQVSGGEIQRAVLARVLAFEPKYLVLDEPTSMLDPSIQAHVLRLLQQQQEEKEIGMLFISHDLDVVKVMSDRVAVMRSGRIVEEGPTDKVFSSPREEYTRSLIDEF